MGQDLGIQQEGIYIDQDKYETIKQQQNNQQVQEVKLIQLNDNKVNQNQQSKQEKLNKQKNQIHINNKQQDEQNKQNNEIKKLQEDKKLFCVWDMFMTAKVRKESKFVTDIKKIASFDSVDKFLQLYMHMRLPSQITQNTTLYFIKQSQNNIPSWESHIHGSTLQYSVQIDRNSKDIQPVDEKFENMLFSFVGEQLQEPIVSGFSIAIKSDIATFTVWIFDAITKKKTYSRLQLKIANILFCKVSELKFITNVDNIKNKQTLQKNDMQQRQYKNNRNQQNNQQSQKRQQQNRQESKQKQKDEKEFQIIVVDKKKNHYNNNNNKQRQNKQQDKQDKQKIVTIDCSKFE